MPTSQHSIRNSRLLLWIALIALLLTSLATPPASTNAASLIIISDELFHQSSGLDQPAIQAFLEAHTSSLGSYQAALDGTPTSAAQIIAVAGMGLPDDASPRILLTLLELAHHLISTPASTDALEQPFGLAEPGEPAFSGDLLAMGYLLRQAALDFDQASPVPITLADGQAIQGVYAGNGPSAAVAQALGRIAHDPAEFARFIGEEKGSFRATYAQLFGVSPTERPAELAATAPNRFLSKPFQGNFGTGSFFDHDQRSGVFVRFDGTGNAGYDGHGGSDFPMGVGNNLVAAADGTVVDVAINRTEGNPSSWCPAWAGYTPVTGVIVRHNVNGIEFKTTYWHMSAGAIATNPRTGQAFKVNDTVNRGEVIGLSGDTGCSSGPHLHFGVQKSGASLDPFGWCGNYADPYPTASEVLWLPDQVSPAHCSVDPPAYQGEYVGQSFSGSMYAGAVQQASVTVRNTGSATWDANTKLAPVPHDVASPFYDPATWLGSTRIAAAGSVAPGATKTFSFNLRAPAQPGTYTIPFGFVQEGVTWFSSPADGYIWFQITVLAQPIPAAPTNLRVAARTQSSLTLAWNDNATNEQGYRIYRWNGSSWPLIATLGANATSYTNTGLSYIFGYAYLVAPFNASGERAVRVDGYIANAISDFNNDSYSDILWRHAGDGRNAAYLMRGTSISSASIINTVADRNWKIAGVADFNGDRMSDILWRNTVTGQNALYFLSGAKVIGTATINTVASQDWKVAGVGDTNNNGRADILWHNSRTGQNTLYLMDGARIVGSGTINTVANLDWAIVGFDDFNFDNRADILWRNSRTGQNVLYLMDGLRITGSGAINTIANLSWKVAGTGDMNGDGRADILWRNSSTGQNVLYLMDGLRIIGSGTINTLSSAWRAVGAGDYDGNGKADILWRNSSTGQDVIYLMSGSTIARGTVINTVTDGAWVVVGKGSNAPANVGQGLASIEAETPGGADDELGLVATAGGDIADMGATAGGDIAEMGATAGAGLLGPNGEPELAPPAGEMPLPEPTLADMPPSAQPDQATRIYIPIVLR